MNKKRIIILSFIILVFIGIILLFIFRDSTFSLDKEYYGSDGLVEVNAEDVEKLIDEKKSFLLFTYNSFCSFSIPCDSIFLDSAKEKNVIILKIPFYEFKKTSFYKSVKYAPSVIIVKNGKIKSFLDANEDGDLDKYQDTSIFIKWLSKYIKYA